MHRALSWSLLPALLLAMLAGKSLTAQAADANLPSLYVRLGGIYPLAEVVDNFTDKLVSDPVILRNKYVRNAMNHITVAGLKFEITALLAQQAGGPEVYRGRSMRATHTGLHINEAEWQAAMKDLKVTLDKHKVPAREAREVMAIVQKTHDDIVEPASAHKK